MAFDTSLALSIQAARTIDVGRGNGGTPVDPPPVGALYTDDFESYPLGAFNTTGGVLSWKTSNSVAASADRAYSGTRSLKFPFGPDAAGEDSAAEEQFELDKKYTELWFRYKLYVPANYTHRNDTIGANNNKGLMNLWGDSYSGYVPAVSLHFAPRDGESYIYAAWKVNGGTAFNFVDPNSLSAGGDSNNAPTGIAFADRGTWIDWVLHFKVSTIPVDANNWQTGGGNGIVQVWKNGSILIDIQNAHNYYDGGVGDPGGVGDGWNWGYLLGWANSGFTELTELFIDDFVIAETADGVGFSV